MKKLIFTIALLSLFFSCKKEEQIPTAPFKITLNVAVSAENDSPLPGAKVYLYDDKNKFDNNGDHKYFGIADSLGVVDFGNVIKGTYWVIVRDCGDNKDKQLQIVLSDGANHTTVKLFRKGGIRVANNTDHDYNLFINNEFRMVLPAGAGTSVDLVFELGNHVLKLVQKSGYDVYPSVEEATVNVEACKVTYWDLRSSGK